MARIKTSEIVSKDFPMEVGLGNVDGYSTDLVIGVNYDLDIVDGKRQIWDYDGPRTPLTAATTLYLSSTSASDTAVDVLVVGLDSNKDRRTATFTLNGQTAVDTGTWRFVYNMSVVTASTPLGDVYIGKDATPTAGVPGTDADVVSQIIQGKNITHNAFYMVPNGKIAVVTAQRFNTNNLNLPTSIHYNLKLDGVATYETIEVTAEKSTGNFLFAFPVATTDTLGALSAVLPSGSEIFWEATASENNTKVFFGSDITLVDNTLATLR
jgi:hypothetical protein